jgi:hypothetical protein
MREYENKFIAYEEYALRFILFWVTYIALKFDFGF